MSFEDQQGQNADMMQQMQAMLSMAQAGGMGAMAPPPTDPSMPSMPGMDPNVAQAYLTMFQYLTAQQSMGAGAMGLPPMPGMPFPGMTPPYAPSMPPVEPTVAVSVEGMKFQYQLTEDDLHKVFSRYGGVKTIRVDEVGAAAQITFVNYNDASAAMQDLNGKVLNGLEGTLRLSWVSQGQGALAPPYPSMPFPGMGFPGSPFGSPAGWPPAGGGAAPGANAPAAMGGYPGAGGPGAGGAGAHTKGVRKYTCRFIIGIQNDKEFQVARRVIGAKGANMKRIVMQSEAKLRLRGEGSGYFEGSGQKESSEPLQLCVSCTNGEQYKSAVRQVEELLKRVYDEYRVFCRDNGKACPDLQINFSENQLVYSAARSPPGVGGVGALRDMDDDDDLSPKKEQRRSRRSRGAKGGSGGKAADGDDDRGEPGPNAPPPDEIENMIDMRNEARRACNFAEADRIREALHSNGVALMDEPGGRGRGAEVTTWRYWRD